MNDIYQRLKSKLGRRSMKSPTGTTAELVDKHQEKVAYEVLVLLVFVILGFFIDTLELPQLVPGCFPYPFQASEMPEEQFFPAGSNPGDIVKDGVHGNFFSEPFVEGDGHTVCFIPDLLENMESL